MQAPAPAAPSSPPLFEGRISHPSVHCERHTKIECDTAWSVLSPLSEASIEKGDHPVEVPDFTEGRWMEREPKLQPDGQY